MKKSLLIPSVIAALLLTACNTPPPGDSFTESDVLTAAALTVQAALTPRASPTAPTIASSTRTVSPSGTTTTTAATSSPSPTMTMTITPTYSVPMLKINGNTNCRTGPGENYEIIFTFLPGATAEIVGQYPQDNYWIVKLPDSSSTCWAWGQFATTSGSFWVVPTLQPPATRTPAPPHAPTGLTYDYFCTFNGVNTNIDVNLKWTDRSDDEEGFRVLRDGEVVAQLTPNTTTYFEVHATEAGDDVSYTIEAFRGDMTARSGTITFSCQ